MKSKSIFKKVNKRLEEAKPEITETSEIIKEDEKYNIEDIKIGNMYYCERCKYRTNNKRQWGSHHITYNHIWSKYMF